MFDVVAAREAWSEMITQCEADKLVFLDESGVNTDLSRRYGRAIGGERSVDKTPLNTPANMTILSSVRLNGETAYTIYSGGTTREKFLDYLKNTLIPTLHEGVIVVMDNMRTHHVKEVQTLLQKAGMKLLYLPAYSPDLNPIENMWSKEALNKSPHPFRRQIFRSASLKNLEIHKVFLRFFASRCMKICSPIRAR